MRVFLKSMLLTITLAFLFSSPAKAQDCDALERFPLWVPCKHIELAEEHIKARINQKNNTNQVESPSLSGNSTSLVDQSSAADFLSAAINLAGLTSKTEGTETSAFSVSVSAYALYAAAKSHDPLDPAFYNRHRAWRRLSVSLGAEYPDEGGASSNERATLVGVKYLIWNRRDLTHPSWDKNWAKLQQANLRAGIESIGLLEEVRNFVLAKLWGIDLNNPEQKDAAETKINTMPLEDLLKELRSKGLLEDIENLIKQHIEAHVRYVEVSQELINSVRKAPQFSLAYQSKTRKENGTDEHRLEAVFDYGIPQVNNLNLSVNASFDYKDSKTTGGDKRGGRLAAEGKYQIRNTRLDEKKEPMTLSFAGEGNWMNGSTPTYRAQFKLTIPIVNGINLPASVTWANRTELIKESDVRGRLGFSVDVAKILSGFKSWAPVGTK